jgi:hypothetical protein
MVLVRSTQGVSPVIGVATRFGDGRASSIKTAEFDEGEVKVQVRCLHQKLDSSQEASQVKLKYRQQANEFSTKSKFVNLLNLSMDREGDNRDGEAFWSISLEALQAMVDFRFPLIEESLVKEMKKIIPSHDDVQRCFVASTAMILDIIAIDSAQACKNMASKADCFACPACTMKNIPSRKQFRIHIAAHLKLTSNVLNPSVGAFNFPSFPCSQCAQHSAIQKGDTSETSSAGCQVSISKKYNKTLKKTVPTAVILCKVLGKVEYIIANENKSTKTNPFTNVPIACPECKHCISKYSFDKHWASVHESKVKSDDLLLQLELDDQEKDVNNVTHFVTHLQRSNTTRPAAVTGCTITTTTTASPATQVGSPSP